MIPACQLCSVFLVVFFVNIDDVVVFVVSVIGVVVVIVSHCYQRKEERKLGIVGAIIRFRGANRYRKFETKAAFGIR